MTIDQIFAFVQKDEQGREQLMFWCEGGAFKPLIAYTWAGAHSLIERAQALSEQTGRGYRVMRFVMPQDVTRVVDGTAVREECDP